MAILPGILNAQFRKKIDLNADWKVASLERSESVHGQMPDLKDESLSWYHGDMPKQVQEFIFEKGELPDPAVEDNAKEWVEVFRKDWLYHKEFKTPDFKGDVVLCFDGLDTEVDVFLNGRKIAYCNNMHRRWRIPVSENLNPSGEMNRLALRFYQPYEVIGDFIKRYPETEVQDLKYIRKCVSDFKSYMGADPPFLKAGVYDDVFLDIRPDIYFGDLQVQSFLRDNYTSAELKINTEIEYLGDKSITYQIFKPNGELLTKGKAMEEKFSVFVKDPELWYPMSYGDQPLYRIQLELKDGSKLLDQASLEFGIRDVQIVQKDEETGNPLFCIQVNGQKIFMSGACWAPLKGFTHVWDEAKADTLLRMMKDGNMNFMRIWGAGTIPGKSLYEYCDRNGIMIMMDFMFTAPLRLPTEIGEFSENVNREIEDVVKRLRNHPSIAFWSGGNEQYLSHKSNLGDNTEPIGREFYQATIPALVEQHDPQRYFHPSSPWGGDDWINGNHPLHGDYHDYSAFRFQPLSSVPLFTTEVCMTSPYAAHNMRKFMSEEQLWPEGFRFSVNRPGKIAWPQGWQQHTVGSAWEKMGRIDDYCDIENVEDACRVFGTAHGQYLKERYERQRRGVPDGMDAKYRRSWGAAIWRLNDTWPIIYMSVVDYYLEPKIPYYFLSRACEPLLISFEQTDDRICVWVVNDTPDEIRDTLTVELMTFDGNKKSTVNTPVELGPSESMRVIDLTNEFYEIWKRREFLVARLRDQVKTHTLHPEKYLKLPEAKITAEYSNEVLSIEADKFVMGVELLIPGVSGAVFMDNYFDLVPGEKVEIGILEDMGGKELTVKGINSNLIKLDLN